MCDQVLAVNPESPVELISNLQEKQGLLDAGDSEHGDIKPALILGSGAMRGVYSGGVVTALEELGLTETFDHVIGVSAGACTAAYFLSGQAALGTTIYYEELASKRFIDPLRFGNIMDIGYLEQVFTNTKPLDIPAIGDNRTNYHVGVTKIEDVTPDYVEVVDDIDVIKLIQASSSVPGLTPPVEIDGVLYGDGVTTCRNPIGFALDTLGCTDVLYVANQPLRANASMSLGDRALSGLIMRGYDKPYRRAYSDRYTGSDILSATEYDDSVNIGILCPEEAKVGRLTRDASRLKAVAEEGRLQTLQVFGG